MVTLKVEMVQLNETIKEMKDKFRHETEKLWNNEPSGDATSQGDFELSFDELVYV